MKKESVAIYARVSGQQQKDDHTIDSQISTILDYCNHNNYKVPTECIFKDEGYTGSNLDRPSLDALRDLAQERVLDVIIVSEPDRLSRDYTNLLILEAEFKKLEIDIIYIKGPRIENEQDRMLRHFQGIFAEYERAQILDRSRRGKLHKVREGNKNMLPKAPYGYDKNRGVNFYSVIPEHAAIVKDIFRLYTQEGYTIRKIGSYLDEKNIPTPERALKWSSGTLRDILSNSAYIGTAHYGKTELGEGVKGRIARYKNSGKFVKAKKPKRDLPKEDWHPIQVPQLISENDFEMAQERLKKNKELASRNTKHPTLLQGLLVCGKCGSTYYKASYKSGKHNKITRYYCRTQIKKEFKFCGNISIRQDMIDAAIWKEIISLLSNPELLMDEIDRRAVTDIKQEKYKKDKKEFEKELGKQKQMCDRIIDAYQDGCITLEDFKSRTLSIRSKISDLQKGIKNMEANEIQFTEGKDLKLSLEFFMNKINKSSEELSVMEKQMIIRSLVEEIIVKEDEITINHVIPVFSSKNSQLCSATRL